MRFSKLQGNSDPEKNISHFPSSENPTHLC